MAVIIGVCTACLCLCLLVGGIVAAVLVGKMTPDLLGKVANPSAASGLLGLGVLLTWIIRAGMRRDP
jgi:predicted Kef-type K+ transport protein